VWISRELPATLSSIAITIAACRPIECRAPTIRSVLKWATGVSGINRPDVPGIVLGYCAVP
jgi:hypothetical protein